MDDIVDIAAGFAKFVNGVFGGRTRRNPCAAGVDVGAFVFGQNGRVVERIGYILGPCGGTGKSVSLGGSRLFF